jgi:uncharacterized membrane protein YdjX (TVP38/TMEM64 family)
MSKPLLACFLASCIACFFLFDLQQYLSLELLKESQENLKHWYQLRPTFFLATYTLLYIALTALALPGMAVLSLAGGAIFGFFLGLFVVSFASSVGATLAFLAARFLLREQIQHRFAHQVEAINAGIQEQGAYYLLSLRLIPLVPFSATNLVMGLTKMKTWTFYWVSQVGMLAGTALFVHAGTELARIDSLESLFSPRLLASFSLLALFPLLLKKIMPRLSAGTNKL